MRLTKKGLTVFIVIQVVQLLLLVLAIGNAQHLTREVNTSRIEIQSLTDDIETSDEYIELLEFEKEYSNEK